MCYLLWSIYCINLSFYLIFDRLSNIYINDEFNTVKGKGVKSQIQVSCNEHSFLDAFKGLRWYVL